MSCKHFAPLTPTATQGTMTVGPFVCPWCEIDQLRGTLSLAEEGLANYAQENAALSDALSAANSDAVRLQQENQRLRDALNQAKERAYAEYGRLCEAVRPEPQSPEQT